MKTQSTNHNSNTWQTKITFFASIIRDLLLYASEIWSPEYEKTFIKNDYCVKYRNDKKLYENIYHPTKTLKS